jgi:hypothetical protein
MSSATSNCQSFSPSVLFFEIVGPSGLVPGSGVPSSVDLSKVVQPTYSDFGSRAGGFIPGNNQFFYGDFNSIQVTQVPEPSTGMPLIWILPVLGIVMVRSRGLAPPRDCSRWLIKTFTAWRGMAHSSKCFTALKAMAGYLVRFGTWRKVLI